ncbi:MAG: phosphoribosylglycinamide formyltransferase [Opitutaceae bacterium]
MNIGFLASHRGSNMQAVVAACRAGRLDANPAVLISNNRQAECLVRAQAQQVPTVVLNAITHPDPDALDAAMLEALQRHACDLIVLAGFMKKIGPRVLATYRNRIINIHPSILPKHGGRGMYGLAVHEAVLASGDKVTGVTVHLVNAEYDEGRILAQCEVPVRPDDTVDTLAARVLAREHSFLIDTLQAITTGKVLL